MYTCSWHTTVKKDKSTPTLQRSGSRWSCSVESTGTTIEKRLPNTSNVSTEVWLSKLSRSTIKVFFCEVRVDLDSAFAKGDHRYDQNNIGIVDLSRNTSCNSTAIGSFNPSIAVVIRENSKRLQQVDLTFGISIESSQIQNKRFDISDTRTTSEDDNTTYFSHANDDVQLFFVGTSWRSLEGGRVRDSDDVWLCHELELSAIL